MSSKNDNNWDELLREAEATPEVPRDRMWQAIDAARQDRRGIVTLPQAKPNRARVWRMMAGIAAILVLGVAIGRMTVNPEVPVLAMEKLPAPTTINPVAEKEVYRLAATDLFGRADFLLTDFKVRSCSQDDLGEVPSWAGGMLLQTRMLMDTPVANDADMQQLLEELELVLAQIVGLSRNNCARDMAWIKQGLQERSTLGRLRMASDSGTQGAL